MEIKTLLSKLPPELDYQSLMAVLPPSSHPRRKLKELQEKGYLIRLKKGFYLISGEVTAKKYSTRIAANLLYGPSYISLEYALQFYGLIPERVEELTSVSTQKNKTFETQICRFTYRHLHPSLYVQGITLRREQDGRNFVIATVEKSLLDIFTLRFSSKDKPQKADLVQALERDLRIDLSELKTQVINRDFLISAQPNYRNRPWCRLLLEYLLEL